MVKTWLIILVLLLVWYIYALQFQDLGKPKFFLDDVGHLLKTGDIILFKANNNFNSLMHTSYFGHCGIIYVGDDNIPMLFEANGIDHMPLREHHSRTGIFFTPVIDRIKKYKGRCYLKQLSEPLEQSVIDGFREFIDYCMVNFKYDMKVVSSGMKKYFGLKKCDTNTNCGDITFLSLIKLGLLDISEYDKPRLHHLKYVVNVENLLNGYYYRDLVEIIDHPFDK
jgi:hypothetical protein